MEDNRSFTCYGYLTDYSSLAVENNHQFIRHTGANGQEFKGGTVGMASLCSMLIWGLLWEGSVSAMMSHLRSGSTLRLDDPYTRAAAGALTCMFSMA